MVASVQWLLIIALTHVGLGGSQGASQDWNCEPTERYADQPDSWLVLYNLNVPESIEWAIWYRDQRNIPPENMIGLYASTSEHLNSLADVQAQLVGPVRAILENDPELRERIMGILLGYRLPGHYASPPLGGPGGYSVADAFQDMTDDDLPPNVQKGYNLLCPHFSQSMLPPEGRLTKSRMPDFHHIVARIDAPTLELAKAMTTRAKAIESQNHYLMGEIAGFDYSDTQFSAGVWPWLQDAVNSPELMDVPWLEFDSDVEGIDRDAFRIDTHDVANWNNGRLFSEFPGSRIFAYNFNSWGATTVRSTTAENGRFVPNAIANGYAAGIGSTGEPQYAAPLPKILVGCLREGWTLGESFFLCNPLNDWMWTLVGDPFLRVPNWFPVEPRPPAGNGDIDGNGVVDGVDIVLLSQIYAGIIDDPILIANADMSGDGRIDEDDIFLILGPALWGTAMPWHLQGTGDLDGDGQITGLDLLLFVQMIMRPSDDLIPLQQAWAADMNRDGTVSVCDVPQLIDALLTNPPN